MTTNRFGSIRARRRYAARTLSWNSLSSASNRSKDCSLPARDAGERRLDREIEEVRSIGVPLAPALVELVDALLAEPPARTLVGARGVRVPVAEDVRSGGEGGLDHRHEVMPPVRHHEEELGTRVDVIPGMEERFAQVPPELRPAGVPRREDREAPGLHPRGGARDLRGLSRALDPLESQEKSAGHDAGFSHAGSAPAPERHWHAVRILRQRMSVLTPDPSSPEGAVGVPGRSPRRLLVFVGVLGCLLAAPVRRGHVHAEGLRRRRARPVLHGRHPRPRPRPRGARPKRQASGPETRCSASGTTCSTRRPRRPAELRRHRRGRGRGLPREARGGRLRDEARPHAVPSGLGVVLLLRVPRPPLLRPGGLRDLAAAGRPGRAGLLRPVHPLHALLHLPAASVQLLLDRLRRAGRRHARPVPPAGGVPALLPALPEEEDVPVRRPRRPATRRRRRGSTRSSASSIARRSS